MRPRGSCARGRHPPCSRAFSLSSAPRPRDGLRTAFLRLVASARGSGAAEYVHLPRRLAAPAASASRAHAHHTSGTVTLALSRCGRARSARSSRSRRHEVAATRERFDTRHTPAAASYHPPCAIVHLPSTSAREMLFSITEVVARYRPRRSSVIDAAGRFPPPATAAAAGPLAHPERWPYVSERLPRRRGPRP